MPKIKTIVVCASCLRASCVQGIFYCDEYNDSTTVEKTKDELAELNYESSDYWETK